MQDRLEPWMVRDLTEAKAALARHGIVLVRSVETELEPAILSEAKAALASSPNRLMRMKDAELDELMGELRKAAMGSVRDLAALYKRLIAELGTESVVDLVDNLEGIGELFKWERIGRAVEPVDAILSAKGFRPVTLSSPETVSENFALELTERWPAAFDRFTALAVEAAALLKKQQAEGTETAGEHKGRKKARKG